MVKGLKAGNPKTKKGGIIMESFGRENHLKRKGELARKAWRFFIILVLSLSFVYLPSFSFGGEVDVLIEKLVEKGLLTKQDAESIIKEIKNETAKKEKEKETQKAVTKESEVTKDTEVPKWAKDILKEIPDWVKNVKFRGDLRLRYQWEDKEDDNKDDRHRGRFRLRLGAETNIVKEVKVGFGIASGSGDPRSTNITFGNSSEKKTVVIDYAFAQYTPVNWFSLIAGKIHNPIYRPSDLLWDSDITPEGIAAKFQYPILPKIDVFFNTGIFILDERDTTTSSKDPYMVVLQPGMNWKITEDINFQLAFAYYFFGGVKGNTLDYSSNSNTLLSGPTRLKYKYNAPVVSAEFGYKNPFGLSFIPYFGLFGEYVYNPDPSKDNEGFIAGLRVGHRDLKKFADWSFEYSYRQLKKDAWLGIFPDSDFYGGATNVKGHEVIFNFALWKNIWLALDYYNSRKILGTPKQTENLLQVDFNFKF
jgi:hypothetical protein